MAIRTTSPVSRLQRIGQGSPERELDFDLMAKKGYSYDYITGDPFAVPPGRSLDVTQFPHLRRASQMPASLLDLAAAMSKYRPDTSPAGSLPGYLGHPVEPPVTLAQTPTFSRGMPAKSMPQVQVPEYLPGAPVVPPGPPGSPWQVSQPPAAAPAPTPPAALPSTPPQPEHRFWSQRQRALAAGNMGEVSRLDRLGQMSSNQVLRKYGPTSPAASAAYQARRNLFEGGQDLNAFNANMGQQALKLMRQASPPVSPNIAGPPVKTANLNAALGVGQAALGIGSRLIGWGARGLRALSGLGRGARAVGQGARAVGQGARVAGRAGRAAQATGQTARAAGAAGQTAGAFRPVAGAATAAGTARAAGQTARATGQAAGTFRPAAEMAAQAPGRWQRVKNLAAPVVNSTPGQVAIRSFLGSGVGAGVDQASMWAGYGDPQLRYYGAAAGGLTGIRPVRDAVGRVVNWVGGPGAAARLGDPLTIGARPLQLAGAGAGAAAVSIPTVSAIAANKQQEAANDVAQQVAEMVPHVGKGLANSAIDQVKERMPEISAEIVKTVQNQLAQIFGPTITNAMTAAAKAWKEAGGGLQGLVGAASAGFNSLPAQAKQWLIGGGLAILAGGGVALSGRPGLGAAIGAAGLGAGAIGLMTPQKEQAWPIPDSWFGEGAAQQQAAQQPQQAGPDLAQAAMDARAQGQNEFERASG